MGVFGFLKKNGKECNEVKAKEQPIATERTFRKERFRVLGLAYHEKNIMKLATKNHEWEKSDSQLIDIYSEEIKKNCAPVQVYKYKFTSKQVKLVPDPKNQYDKNTVDVFIAGEKIGWVQGDDGKKLANAIKNGSVKYITAFISGGEIKSIALKDVTESSRGFYATISIGYSL